jgi:hypothetical protein
MEFKFTEPQELRNWLLQQGLDISCWSGMGKKTFEDLWAEVLIGDCTLTKGPIRVVKFLSIEIRRKNLVLHEIKQQLRDGTTRERNQPPAEKIRPGESVKTALLRCLRDELGLHENSCRIVLRSEEPTFFEEDSRSYPGLKTHYLKFSADVFSASLPEEDFSTEEQAGCDSSVLRHWWSWIEAAESRRQGS